MAHMIPSQCPPETASQAEKELFEALRHGLGPHYTVIHSLPWLSDERRRLREGECDFLLLHPEHGMLALETKSGEIRFDGTSRSWIRGESQIVDDPFLQAERSVHELNHRLCERLPAWRNAGVPFGYAVVLPHADRFRGALPPHVHPDILILRPDLPRLAWRVDEILARNKRRPFALDPATMKDAIEVLLPTFQVVRSLATEIADQDACLFRLTEQQIAFFEGFSSNRRMIVEGVAGSGKTVLAREAALRLSAGGHRVLLLCFNIPLADLLREQVKNTNPQVDVFHFHSLCEHVVRETGGQFVVPAEGVERFYNETAPELLSAALPRYSTRYTAILVDEGQDFCDLWWLPLEELLADKTTGFFYIFLDRRQNIFRREGNLPFSGPRYVLASNCRNTAAIARLVQGLGGVSGGVPAWVPEGVEPVFTPTEDEAGERGAIRSLLHRLVQEQGLRAEQIVILGAHRFANSIFRDHPGLGRFTVVDRLDAGGPSEIRYSTLHRFKGLEADCVILSGVGGGGWQTEEGRLREQLYVAASRARVLLYVFERAGSRVGEMARTG
jgi:hypothetical protein